jgi:hypothetical protein
LHSGRDSSWAISDDNTIRFAFDPDHIEFDHGGDGVFSTFDVTPTILTITPLVVQVHVRTGADIATPGSYSSMFLQFDALTESSNIAIPSYTSAASKTFTHPGTPTLADLLAGGMGIRTSTPDARQAWFKIGSIIGTYDAAPPSGVSRMNARVTASPGTTKLVGPLPSVVALTATIAPGDDFTATGQTWAILSKPVGAADPTISAPTSLTTNVTFSAYTPGTYAIQIVVTGTLTDEGVDAPPISDIVIITVPPPRAPTVGGGSHQVHL